MRRPSIAGFLGSLLFHGGIAAALFFSFKENDNANGMAAQIIDTNISMEMMMATMVEETQPTAEPEPQTKEEIVQKEAVEDPTLKKEKPKEKPREKPKEKAKKVPPPVQQGIKADKIVLSNANANSKATGLSNTINSDNPNLAGQGTGSSEVDAYKIALRREIERHKRYSQRAKMMRKQGTVIVAFNIGNDGSLSNARVVKSSGTEDLDNSALEAVKNAKSIGQKPAGMANAISVPIAFTIR
ncbi:TonB family protein [Basfia succiniciproducens]|uniref:TonB family protein n=1 Tax=Basfia succiniciproducens TaxID=653940 RepID=UPI0008AC0F85|nr:energy transducer TonB [Basfia succiniciproducens]SEQ46982.1 outer membrane transport energization protein TonB [Basfia succiniciproducens]